MPTNEELFARARRVIPGGVSSPVRGFSSVGGTPYFVEHADGPYVWDEEGRRYVDLVQSYGAVILGHADAQVTSAVARAAERGTSYGAPTLGEVRLAEEIRDRVAGVEQVRLVNSGTEATMSAIRLARGHTGRNRVVKFAGNYHGHSDMLLVAGGSGVATLGLPGSAGVPDNAVADTLVAPYNEVPELDERIACVIVEPVAANMGVVPPRPGFLEGLREECDRVGALLMFDEVITGFRIARGGAQEVYGVRPDLWCFGKVIGGGLPIGAFCGPEAVMGSLAPRGAVYQAGTLSGNPLATAAGHAVLERLTPDVYDTLRGRARYLAEGLRHVLATAGVEAQVVQAETLVGLYFGPEAPVDYDTAKRCDETRYATFMHGLLDRGVAIAPGAYEALFPGVSHTEAVLDEVLEAATDAAASVASVATEP